MQQHGTKQSKITRSIYTLVDEVLKYRIPTSVPYTYYRIIHKKLLEYAEENKIHLLEDNQDLSYEDKENFIMYNELNSRRKHEQYSSLMKRVYDLAKIMKSERRMIKLWWQDERRK